MIKLPGVKVFPLIFIKLFLHLIGKIVADSLTPGFEKGKLHSEQSRGVVTFLKTNKDFYFFK